MRIGFTGAHRTGKSTLAEFVHKVWGVPWVQSPASQIVKEFGFDMGRDNRLSFSTRPLPNKTGAEMQQEIYDTLIKRLEQATEFEGYVSDRTPIDVAAYMMADATAYAGDPEDREFTVGLMERATSTRSSAPTSARAPSRRDMSPFRGGPVRAR